MEPQSFQIGITPEQADKIFKFQHRLLKRIDYESDKKEFWLGQIITLYLSTIAIDAEAENAGLNVENAHKKRRSYVTKIADRIGKYPTADDINKFMENYLEIDGDLKEIIQKDLESLKSV